MATSYECGETAVLDLEVYNRANGVLEDPATYIRATIWNSIGSKVVDAQNMVRDGIGKYHYDYLVPAAGPLGTWQVLFEVADGARVTKQRDSFDVHT